MKKFTGAKVLQKIVIAFLTVIMLFQFMMPIRSEAIDLMNMEMPEIPDVFRYMAQIASGFGDLIMSMFNNAMLGTSGYGTAMISHETLDQTNSWFVNDGVADDYSDSKFDKNADIAIGEDSSGNNIVIYVKADTLEKNIIADSDEWEVPNMLYCPENIFGNNIAMLDVNFLNPNTYTAVVDTTRGEEHALSIADDRYDANGKVTTIGLKTTIKNWYRTLRNLAIVALLSILVYLGIRILISSTAEDKAKYKEVLKDWFIALVLVFIMHFIMSAIIMVVNQINNLFNNVNKSVYINYGGTVFKTNFTGAMRFLAQSKTANQAWVYTIIYWGLIVYTGIFTIQYLKRVLYIAFYTMISPLVAITYPLDKLGDGKSQAFNKWFKEYSMTMALQPIHLIIYTMVVSTALSLSIQNPIFALVAIGFLIPAEQFIRSLFGVESKADGGFGSFASGALTMKALDALRKPKFGGPGGKGEKAAIGSGEEEDSKVRQVSNKELEHWKGKNKDNNEAKPQLGAENENTDTSKNDNDEDKVRLDSANNPELSDGNVGPIIPDDGVPIEEMDKTNSEYWNKFDQEHGIDQAAIREGLEQDGLDPDKYLGSELANERDKAYRADKIKEQEEARQAKEQAEAEQKYKNLRSMRRRQYGKKLAITGAKGLGKGVKFVAKTGIKATGAGVFGTIGLAAGIASGKGIGGAIKGAAAGAAAGIAVGTTATNLAGRATNRVIKDVKYRSDSVKNYQANKVKDLKNAGLDNEAKAYQDKINSTPINRARRFAKYDKMVDEYAMKQGKNFTGEERKGLRQRISDYDQNYGITDKDKIFKGLQLEEQYKGQYSHEEIADVMQLTETYGRQYITDKKKYEEFNNNLEAHGITGKNKDAINELFFAANDAVYNKPKQETVRSNTSERVKTNNNTAKANKQTSENLNKNFEQSREDSKVPDWGQKTKNKKQ